MAASAPNASRTPDIIDAGKFTRTQVTALSTVLKIQRAAHVSPNYRQHLSTLVLRALPFDDLCVVTEALLSTIHLAQARPEPPQRVVA
jgi:hypothetical protein